MKIPKAIEKVIEGFEKLPGIGPKTAQRLTFYLLHVPQSELDSFAFYLQNLKKNTVLCSSCFNVGDSDPCFICSDITRDKGIICVVEDMLDVVALEKSGKYNGVYHVLHGLIDPLNSIGPDEIYIPQLITKLSPRGEAGKAQNSKVREIILATNPTMEGEATAMYILKKIKSQKTGHLANSGQEIKITRIGHGLPIGSDLEYADEVTLERALEGRREY